MYNLYIVAYIIWKMIALRWFTKIIKYKTCLRAHFHGSSSQLNYLLVSKTGVMCSLFRVRITNSAAQFWILCRRLTSLLLYNISIKRGHLLRNIYHQLNGVLNTGFRYTLDRLMPTSCLFS